MMFCFLATFLNMRQFFCVDSTVCCVCLVGSSEDGLRLQLRLRLRLWLRLSLVPGRTHPCAWRRSPVIAVDGWLRLVVGRPPSSSITSGEGDCLHHQVLAMGCSLTSLTDLYFLPRLWLWRGTRTPPFLSLCACVLRGNWGSTLQL